MTLPINTTKVLLNLIDIFPALKTVDFRNDQTGKTIRFAQPLSTSFVLSLDIPLSSLPRISDVSELTDDHFMLSEYRSSSLSSYDEMLCEWGLAMIDSDLCVVGRSTYS